MWIVLDIPLNFNCSCPLELPENFKKTLDGLGAATATQDSSTASPSDLRKQLEKIVTLPSLTKWTLIKANGRKKGTNKLGTQDMCKVKLHQSRQNPGCSLSERMPWRHSLLSSEEAVFITSEPQILPCRKRTQGRFGCPQGSSVEDLLSLRENLRLNPLKGNEPTASQSNSRMLRKRTWETFSLSHCVLGGRPDFSPARKRRRMNFLYYTKGATGRASLARTTPRRKRTRETLGLSRYVLRRVRDRSSPARKKMKMSIAHSARDARARQRNFKRNSLRKRKWHTFVESHNKSSKCPRCTSPQRKKIRTGFPP